MATICATAQLAGLKLSPACAYGSLNTERIHLAVRACHVPVAATQSGTTAARSINFPHCRTRSVISEGKL